jgi:NAD(P)-dependent dehydrogenase (short-subunit alcohol dehydrogenase family)
MVLLVGATGAFGERLAEGLIRAGIGVIAAARNRTRLEALAQRLGAELSIAVLDRNSIDADRLTALRPRWPGLYAVADASGPFQDSNDRLPRAAIGAGLHYVDLADGRAFVSDIARLHQQAVAAHVAVLAGASSTPALSHAVLDMMIADASRVIAIDVSIAPGNRAPRGLSVVQSILSTVGQPIRVFHGGRWTEARGWTLNKTIGLPGIGARSVALCETPDLDLLVARYRPAADAVFRAGLELPLLHRGLAALGLLVRLHVVGTLTPFARPLRSIADLFEGFGSDRGGMQVDALIEDQNGLPTRRLWTMSADAGVGPFVPTLPALAALKMLADGTLTWRGAAPCTGLIPYEAIASEFNHHGITTERHDTAAPPSLLRRVLGNSYDALPAAVRQAHEVRRVLVLEGRADVSGSRNVLALLLSRLFGFPPRGPNLALRVEMRSEDDGSETWTRDYPGVTMRSRMCNPDPSTRQFDEVFGPFAIRLQGSATTAGLLLEAVGVRLFGIPLPRFLRPRSSAREFVGADGLFHFDVAIALPLIGPVVRYRGHLAPPHRTLEAALLEVK